MIMIILIIIIIIMIIARLLGTGSEVSDPIGDALDLAILHATRLRPISLLTLHPANIA